MADSYITAVLQSDLPSSRYLTATNLSGILLQDNGPLQPINITTNGILNSISTQYGSSGYIISNGYGTASIRSFANSSTVTITNPSGVAGQTSFTVVPNSSTQNITTQVSGGAITNARGLLNFIPGAGIGVSTVDDGANNRTNITITSSAGGGGGAPIDATYWLSTANGTLTNEVNLGALTSGVLGINVSAGVATPYKVTQIYEDTGLTNLFIGTGAGNPLHPTNTNNLGIGSGSLFALTTGYSNTMCGVGAGSGITTGIQNFFAGTNAGAGITTGNGNVYIGPGSGGGATASYNTCVGLNAGGGAGSNSSFGMDAMFTGNASGGNSVAIGVAASYLATNSGATIAIGLYAGAARTTYTNCTFLGTYADTTVDNLTNATAIGYNAHVSTSNTMVLGENNAIVIGDTTGPTNMAGLNMMTANNTPTIYVSATSTTPTANTTGGTLWVDSSNNLNYINATANYNLLAGGGGAPTNAQYWLSTANGTLTSAVNLGALTSGVLGITVNTGVATPYIVTQIYEDTSLINLFIGTDAGNPLHPTSTNNLGIGSESLVALTTGIANVAVGSSSGSAITTGSTNTAVGVAAFNVATDVHGSVALGYESGSSQTTYTDCTFLGANSDANVNGLTNATAIGYNARISTSNTMVLGQNNAIVIGDTTGPTNMAGLNMMTANNTPTIYVSATSTTPTANTTGGTLWVDSSNQLSYMNTNAASKVAVASIGGSAATCGIGTLGVGSTVTVNTAAVTANSIILTQLIGNGIYTLGVLSGSTVPGVSFYVNIYGGAAPGTSFFWFLVNPV